MTIPESAAAFAEAIAADDSHGYSQASRWGNPDYDCSALVCDAYDKSGVPVRAHGASYTGNMVQAFTQCGFVKLAYYNGMTLLRGDVLLNIKSHTAIYCGNNKLVEACIDENGRISGGRPGDQTGHEIHVRLMYNYPWDCVLRYSAQQQETADPGDPACSYTAGNAVQYQGPQIQYKDYGPAIAAAQGALNYHGFGHLAVNGYFSQTMETEVRKFQKVKQLEVDGIIGPMTWRALMYWR